MSQKKEPRNLDLIRDYTESNIVYGRRVWKYSVVEVAKMYNVTDARLQQILDMYGITKRSAYKVVKVKKYGK